MRLCLERRVLPCTRRLIYDRGSMNLTTKTSFLFFARLICIVVGGSLCLSAMSQTAARHISHLAAPTELRCEGESEPLAISDAKPEFSWKVQAASPLLHAVRQSGYQIRIATHDRTLIAGQGLFWDSGKVPGNGTSFAGDAYAGPAFESQHDYDWQVRVWDEKDQASPWSRPAHWRQAPIWRAQWIAADATDGEAGARPMPLLRRNFSLPGTVTRAVLHVSGLGQYEFRINGVKVGNSELTPGWSDYHKTIFYDSYDVTKMVRDGANALGVMLGNGMYRVPETPGRYNKFTGSFGPPKCIALLHIELASGKSIDIVSDGSWKTRPGPITFSSTYGGEDYDARREIDGWDRAGFDDADWNPVEVTTSPGRALRPEASSKDSEGAIELVLGSGHYRISAPNPGGKP
jgi:alpha-L-rhamnosidase